MVDLDENYMELALELAALGEGDVNPNPMVGAVVVKVGEIIGKGYHKKYGGPHAEVFALDEAGKESEGATIYVTLEPCSHYGKTPPCAEKIIKMGIKRCVIATLDPNPLVAGKGAKLLENAGIEVKINVLKDAALKQNIVFFKYIEGKIPYLFLKCAITLDGKIATENGDSKWISNEISRARVQGLRHKYMGIMVGIKTLLGDNPRLNARIEGGNNPHRIVVDPGLKTPENYNFIQNNSDNKSIIITSKENIQSGKHLKYEKKYKVKFIFLDGNRFLMVDILKEIGKLGIDSILLEGGNSMISMAFKEKALDGGEIFIAPKITGDNNAIPFVSGFKIGTMKESIELKDTKFNIYGDNIAIEFSL
ncbi:bifunctional diaminohydroxyphosphoribosylaminopyrimidine deaminase/5-amino-6-(5-phosphoribosylamino)uracil reductase RibD [Psychrilyobacter sp.]|uniref:bifunctional diaminohydroxyphosphoribosylaminopyrimidine deaminase/5-amino-6-(5-phosphoribosylamino)uracil reductase RibD n=1 Tax=Psychrilyobacter sp. TaxID=2586924 RepID=UPI0030196A7C